MDEFFTILIPLAQGLVDNIGYIILALTMLIVKETRYIGLIMIAGFAFFGFQRWIIIACVMFAILLIIINRLCNKHDYEYYYNKIKKEENNKHL